MLAVAGPLPQDGGSAAGQPGHAWAFEMKWDGVRAIIHRSEASSGRVRVLSRNDRDVSVSYPELAGLADVLPPATVVDGEIVAFDASGRPSFGRLQSRMHVADPAAARRLAGTDPAVFLAFDLLYLRGEPLLERPYTERRAQLEELALTGGSWQTPPVFHGNGPAAVETSLTAGLEGVVAKRLTSRYVPGRRSPDWIKIKHARAQEVVLIGWKPGGGRRAGTLGSLLLAVPDAGELHYAGGVGTGFTDAMLADLLTRLRSLEVTTAPAVVPRADAREAHWVEPVLVGEVAFTEWTGDGRLRHPSWRGLRPDKSPADVVRES